MISFLAASEEALDARSSEHLRAEEHRAQRREQPVLCHVQRERQELLTTRVGHAQHGSVDLDAPVRTYLPKFKVADEDFDMIESLYGVGYRYRDA
jgi:hypothetical protein